MKASPETVAVLVSADRLFTVMTRSVTVPQGWVACATRGDRDTLLVTEGRRLDDDDLRDVLFARTTGVTCEATVDDLRSMDGFTCHGSIACTVRVMPDTSDLLAFRQTVLGSGDRVTEDVLQRFLAHDLRRALEALADRHAMEELMDPPAPGIVLAVAREMLGGALLRGGLSLDGDPRVRFDSAVYRQHRREQDVLARQEQHAAARAQIEQALSAARQEKLTHLAQLLERFRDVAEQHDDINTAHLLTAFNENERGELYAALWHMQSDRELASSVAIVSGYHLLWFEPPACERPVRRVRVPGMLGPLRSVRCEAGPDRDNWLLVGAASGIHVVDHRTGDVLQSLAADTTGHEQVHGGVNAATFGHDHLFASHSQLGVLAWPWSESGFGACRPLAAEATVNATTVRCVQISDGLLWFTADDRLCAVDLSAGVDSRPVIYSGNMGVLSALRVARGQAYLGDIEGRIFAWNVGDPASARILRGPGGGPVESIHVLRTGGVDHLVIADRTRVLTAMVVGDNYVRKYEAPANIIRRAAAGDDLLVAMNDTRDLLIFWDPRRPTEPIATVIVPHLTDSTIQDLCLIQPA